MKYEHYQELATFFLFVCALSLLGAIVLLPFTARMTAPPEIALDIWPIVGGGLLLATVSLLSIMLIAGRQRREKVQFNNRLKELRTKGSGIDVIEFARCCQIDLNDTKSLQELFNYDAKEVGQFLASLLHVTLEDYNWDEKTDPKRRELTCTMWLGNITNSLEVKSNKWREEFMVHGFARSRHGKHYYELLLTQIDIRENFPSRKSQFILKKMSEEQEFRRKVGFNAC